MPGSRAIMSPTIRRSSGRSAAIAVGTPPVIVSVHSFTQALKGTWRPWRVGAVGQDRGWRCLCWPAGCGPFPISRSATTTSCSGQLKGDTLYRHGTTGGLAHALIELRQDLILGPEGQAEWALRLAHALRQALTMAGGALHAIELHGSLTDRCASSAGPSRKGQAAMDDKTAGIDASDYLPAPGGASARAERSAEYGR